jgi:alkane 1-monooxygenase
VTEHVYGHHKAVATPADPATARFNESIYAFLPRTIIGSYKNAWKVSFIFIIGLTISRQLENTRLRNEGLPVFSIHNRMIWFIILPALFALAIFGLFGVGGLTSFAIQSVIAFIVFETINYVEHYGLVRNEIAPGKYEPVNLLHSWNSNTSITNSFLIKIQRHSDHHVHALKPYQYLMHIEDTPQLPAGSLYMYF